MNTFAHAFLGAAVVVGPPVVAFILGWIVGALIVAGAPIVWKLRPWRSENTAMENPDDWVMPPPINSCFIQAANEYDEHKIKITIKLTLMRGDPEQFHRVMAARDQFRGAR